MCLITCCWHSSRVFLLCLTCKLRSCSALSPFQTASFCWAPLFPGTLLALTFACWFCADTEPEKLCQTWARNKGLTHVTFYEESRHGAFFNGDEYSSVGTVKTWETVPMPDPRPRASQSFVRLHHHFTACLLPFSSTLWLTVTVPTHRLVHTLSLRLKAFHHHTSTSSPQSAPSLIHDHFTSPLLSPC